MEPTSERAFLPNFCRITMVFTVVLGAQLLAFILVLAAGWKPGQLWEQVSLISFYVQWIALIGAAALCAARRWLERLPNWLAGLGAWLMLMAVTALAAETAWALGETFSALPYYDAGQRWGLMLRSLGITGIAGALMLRYLYLHDQWKRQQVARAEARFQALQARIRPHFLFNSMNTIASLTRRDPTRAERVVLDLADLFRAALSDPEGGSTLGQEIELVRQYLEVEQLRLGGRLRLEWDLDELPQDAPLPLLVLQPLVENAVYHGVEPSIEPGIIRLVGRYRRHRINLSIRNSLPATDDNEHREGNRIALANVRQRLDVLYPNCSSLTLGRVDDEFQVRVVFPYPYRSHE